MEELLENITFIITEYKEMGDKLVFNDAEVISVMLKDLTSNLFFLEAHRALSFEKHNASIFNNMKEGMSGNKAVVYANQEVPELYKLRRIMDSAYKIVDAMRSNISYLKLEK